MKFHELMVHDFSLNSNQISKLHSAISRTYLWQPTITNIDAVTSTSAKAFSYITNPIGTSTLLSYLQSFGVISTSTNTGTGSWVTSFSGDITYTASPITSITYFTAYNRVRIIDGDSTADSSDWVIFNFGIANGNADFDGTYNSNPYFGGENSYSGGTGGQSVTTGYVWGFSPTIGWVLLYQLPLPGNSSHNHTNGGWLTTGTTVTLGNGKRTEFDNTPITHIGFSVT